jgi:hypothetical protein
MQLFIDFLDPEEGGKDFLRNVSKYLHINTTVYLASFESL